MRSSIPVFVSAACLAVRIRQCLHVRAQIVWRPVGLAPQQFREYASEGWWCLGDLHGLGWQLLNLAQSALGWQFSRVLPELYAFG